MADNVMFNVKPEFNEAEFCEKLAETYRAKGYTVNVTALNGSYVISVEKDLGGINTVLGMGEGIKVNVIRNGDVVNVNFTDAEWVSKIIAVCIGWFLGWTVICLAAMVTGIIGVTKQLSLPKSIGTDAQRIAASM